MLILEIAIGVFFGIIALSLIKEIFMVFLMVVLGIFAFVILKQAPIVALIFLALAIITPIYSAIYDHYHPKKEDNSFMPKQTKFDPVTYAVIED